MIDCVLMRWIIIRSLSTFSASFSRILGIVPLGLGKQTWTNMIVSEGLSQCSGTCHRKTCSETNDCRYHVRCDLIVFTHWVVLPSPKIITARWKIFRHARVINYCFHRLKHDAGEISRRRLRRVPSAAQPKRRRSANPEHVFLRWFDVSLFLVDAHPGSINRRQRQSRHRIWA